MGGTPEQFAEHVRRETERLGKLIKMIGIKPQYGPVPLATRRFMTPEDTFP